MRPFFYNMEVIKAYDDGSILEKEVISLSPEDIIAKFQNGVKNLTALSLQTNIPTELTVPNFILNGFKNLAAIGLQIDHKFKQLQGAQSHAPAAEHKEHAKKDDKKEEKPKKEEKVVEAPKEEEPEVDMGGLFDF
jgi:large subunit ribosomal protein LP0